MQIYVKRDVAAGRSSPMLEAATHSEEAKCWLHDDVLTEMEAQGDLRPKKNALAMGQCGSWLFRAINANRSFYPGAGWQTAMNKCGPVLVGSG